MWDRNPGNGAAGAVGAIEPCDAPHSVGVHALELGAEAVGLGGEFLLGDLGRVEAEVFGEVVADGVDMGAEAGFLGDDVGVIIKIAHIENAGHGVIVGQNGFRVRLAVMFPHFFQVAQRVRMTTADDKSVRRAAAQRLKIERKALVSSAFFRMLACSLVQAH